MEMKAVLVDLLGNVESCFAVRHFRSVQYGKMRIEVCPRCCPSAPRHGGDPVPHRGLAEEGLHGVGEVPARTARLRSTVCESVPSYGSRGRPLHAACAASRAGALRGC